MIDFSYYPGDSFIHLLDSRIKFPLILLASVFILTTNGLFCLVISGISIIVLLLLSHLPINTMFIPLKRLWPFLLLIFLMNSLFIKDGLCLFTYLHLCVSETGIKQGANIVLHIYAITVLSLILIRTTTSVGIMKACEFYMKPLRLLGVPTRDLSLMISTAIQFFPVLSSDLDRIRKAQAARGAVFSEGSFLKRISGIYPLIIPAFISAFRRADELAAAVESRGFHSEKESEK